jgi:hypothetical protein
MTPNSDTSEQPRATGEATRADHLAWCKRRALEYLDKGDRLMAFASMISDLGKHPETAHHAAIPLGAQLYLRGLLSTTEKMREFIEVFN